METFSILLAESGPRNPLYFFSLSLSGRLSANLNDAQKLEQLTALHALLAAAPPAIFRRNALAAPVAVCCDALLALLAMESNSAPTLRLVAAQSLHLLVLLLREDVNSLVPVLPGVLSRLVKLLIGRIDVEIEGIQTEALHILGTAVRSFWADCRNWKATDAEKTAFFEKVELAVSLLKPFLLRAGAKPAAVRDPALSLLQAHLELAPKELNMRSTVTIALMLGDLQLGQGKDLASDIYEKTVDFFKNEQLSSTSPEIVEERLRVLLGLIRTCRQEVLIEDVYSIVCDLTRLQLSMGETVSISLDDNLLSGLKYFGHAQRTTATIPAIKFRKRYNLGPDAEKLVLLLWKAISSDIRPSTLLSPAMDYEELIQKLCLMYNTEDGECVVHAVNSVDLVCYPIEQASMIHLALIQLLTLRPLDYRKHLMLLLSGIASDWPILRDYSTSVLKHLLGGNVCEFFASHQDFIVDQLSRRMQLPHLYAETPRIIAAILSNSMADARFVLACSDVLVHRVMEQLALYQRFDSYAADLMAMMEATCVVLSKMEPVHDPSLPPEQEEEKDEDPLSVQQVAALELGLVAQYFVLSDSKRTQLQALKAMAAVMGLFACETPRLCQFIHKAWPRLVLLLQNVVVDRPAHSITQLDRDLMVQWCDFVAATVRCCGSFMRERLVGDFWRKIIKNSRKEAASPFTNSNHDTVLQATGRLLCTAVTLCNVPAEVLLEMLPVADAELKAVIAKVEPDAFWFYDQVQCGRLDSLLWQNAAEEHFFASYSKEDLNKYIL